MISESIYIFWDILYQNAGHMSEGKDSNLKKSVKMKLSFEGKNLNAHSFQK